MLGQTRESSLKHDNSGVILELLCNSVAKKLWHFRDCFDWACNWRKTTVMEKLCFLSRVVDGSVESHFYCGFEVVIVLSFWQWLACDWSTVWAKNRLFL